MTGALVWNTALGMALGSPFGWLLRPRFTTGEGGFMIAMMTALFCLPPFFVLFLLFGPLPGSPWAGP